MQLRDRLQPLYCSRCCHFAEGLPLTAKIVLITDQSGCQHLSTHISNAGATYTIGGRPVAIDYCLGTHGPVFREAADALRPRVTLGESSITKA